jgi:type II secretory pathway pseudopilin PulG
MLVVAVVVIVWAISGLETNVRQQQQQEQQRQQQQQQQQQQPPHNYE